MSSVVKKAQHVQEPEQHHSDWCSNRTNDPTEMFTTGVVDRNKTLFKNLQLPEDLLPEILLFG